MSELEDPLVADGSINSGTLGPEKPAVAVVVAFGAAIGAVVFGYSLGFSSPALPGMEADVFSHDVTCGKDNAVDSETASLWSSIVNVGCMVGAIVGAKILEKFGRRGALLYFAGPAYALTWAATAVAEEPALLLGARVALGVGVGVASVSVPVYIAETAPPSLRGALGATNQLAVTLGILLVYLVGLLLPHRTITYDCGSEVRAAAGDGWRTLAWIGSGMGCLLVVVGVALPETPTWLARRGQLDKAERSLALLRGDKARAALELRELVAKADAEKRGGAADDAVSFGDVVKMCLPAALVGETDPAVRAPLRLALSVMLIQQFSGINAVIFFSGSILGSAGMTNRDLGGCIIMAIQVAMTGLSCVLMDRAGRRSLLLASLAGMTLAAGLMALYFAVHPPPAIALVALVVYIGSFSIGLGAIPWLLMAEILPARARGVASSLATLVNWTCSFVVTETFSDVLAVATPQGTFGLFALVCATGVLYVYAYLPETKGKSLDQIEALFDHAHL